jgi:hypothetical protein
MSDLTPNDTTVGEKPTVLENTQKSIVDNVSAAANAVQNHPATQSVINGPVAQNAKAQADKTSSEFSTLAASRQTPTTPAATGQQLTHYHSFFSTLLSWDNPRASAIAFTSVVLFIFAARYLNILRYAFKLTWVTLGTTVLAEVIGKTILGNGFMTQFRPRKYYTVPKQTLDAALGDLNELINFFVIESQRIVFAENIFASIICFLGAFFSYYLIKIVPVWGLALIGTSITFLAPLVYKTNQELIDHHVKNASNVVNQQTQQVKALASHHASRATEAATQYVGDYSAKAQEMIGRSPSPTAVKTEAPGYSSQDFPAAPTEEFKAPVKEESEPIAA